MAASQRASDLYKAFGQPSSVNDGATTRTTTITVASINTIKSYLPVQLDRCAPALHWRRRIACYNGLQSSLSALLISRRAFSLAKFIVTSTISGRSQPPIVPIWCAVGKDISSRSTSSHFPALLCNHRPHQQTRILLFCTMRRVSPLETITHLTPSAGSVMRSSVIVCQSDK
jgi:hypothetical protein